MRTLFGIGVLFFLFGCGKSTENYETLFTYSALEAQPCDGSGPFLDSATGLSYSGWGVYEDIIFPGTEILWSMNHEMVEGRQVLECAIVGGDAYNNAFFTNTCALQWSGAGGWSYAEVDQLVFSLDFKMPQGFDCAAPNASKAEGLEFTWQHILIPYSHGFGVQFSKGGEWRYWDDTKDANGHPLAWQSFDPPIMDCIEPNVWHHIELVGNVFEDHIQYASLTLDGANYDLSSAELPWVLAQQGWVEHFLQVGVQINGNTATDSSHGFGVDPVSIYLENVQLEGKVIAP
jgi:hypothetical protein